MWRIFLFIHSETLQMTDVIDAINDGSEFNWKIFRSHTMTMISNIRLITLLSYECFEWSFFILVFLSLILQDMWRF